MRAYYDLSRCPPTYDFVSFLVGLEAERLRRAADAIDLHILPGPRGGFRDDMLAPFSIAQRIVMRDDIVIGGANLLPSIRSVVLQPDKSTMSSTCYGYGTQRYGLPVIVEMARQGLFPLRAPDLPGERGFVTITLRECDYWPTRNSNLACWTEIAAQLEKAGRPVRFIRDTAFADKEIPGFRSLTGAARSVVERAGWYAAADLNLFVNNGPAWMCFFMDAPTLVTRMIDPSVPAAAPEFFARNGVGPENGFPGTGPRRRVLWDDDRPEVVVPVAFEMLRQA